MREIVLDTETTGLDPAEGHRIIEIGCLELMGHVPTGKSWRTYLHPERDVPEEAMRIHGLTNETLANAPRFAAVVDELMGFLRDDTLVIHNAEFDLKFLNAELARLARAPIPPTRAIDTITMARRRFPGQRCSLDELCRRFGIDLSARTRHGALLDAELLAQVYLELLGGRQVKMQLSPADAAASPDTARTIRRRERLLPERLTAAEREAHARFIAAELSGDVIWRKDA
ncbi:MAG: DNA polymerase III subunit epsilon [Alphaproteobacteria bacterium]